MVKIGRLHYLDSLRGIAASIVLIFHCLVFFFKAAKGYSDTEKFLLLSVFNGADWVSFFFVLSGFALSFKYLQSDSNLNLIEFFIRRVFRIFPLFLFVMVVVAVVAKFIVGIKGISGLKFVSEALLFSKNPYLVKPSWSLSIEICFSFFFPALIFIAIKNQTLFKYFFVLTLIAYSILNTFLLHFLIGIAIAKIVTENKTELYGLWFRKYAFMLIPFSFVLFSARFLVQIFSPFFYCEKLLSDVLNLNYEVPFFYLSSIPSFILIIWCITSSKLKTFLSNRFFLFLGKTSYSIYIIHFPFIEFFYKDISVFFLRNGLSESSGLVATIFSIFLSVILISSATQYFIEEYFIRLSSSICRTYKHRFSNWNVNLKHESTYST
jgi:peptidoglycan/LPS O-acetylase OafA/YrhL